MKLERTIPRTSHDDWFFEKKYGYLGIKSRYDFFVWKKNKEYGEVYNLVNYKDRNHVSKQKGTGSTDVPDNTDESNKEYTKFEPPRFDIENLFKFNYEEAFNYKPNKKFKKLYSLVFNHNFYNDKKNEKYNDYIKIYNNDLINGNIDKINDLLQRVSQYIIDNNINMDKYVGGSVICVIALMISNYINTGILNTSIDFICKMTEKEMNEEYNSYCLFLLCQVFTTKYHIVNQYISGSLTKKKWKINLIRHRYSDKDMKTKGVCPVFTINSLGEINYVLY